MVGGRLRQSTTWGSQWYLLCYLIALDLGPVFQLSAPPAFSSGVGMSHTDLPGCRELAVDTNVKLFTREAPGNNGCLMNDEQRVCGHP